MILGTSPYGSAPFGGNPLNKSFTALVLQIGPTDVTGMLRMNSYRLRQGLNVRDELEFSLITKTAYLPLLGEQVILSFDAGLIFVGTVHEREVVFLSEKRSDYTVIQVRCVDLNEIADRRLVAEIYEHLSAGEIVRQIVQKYLAPELIQVGNVQEGPMVSRMVCAYLTVAACFDSLCEKSGFVWNIDQQRAANFFARTTSPAPFTITSANAVFRRMRSSRTRNQYRNVQYVDGGRGVTDTIPEFFLGDGTLRTFNVEYPIFAAPVILRAFVPQTIGIRGVDTGKQWYWNKGETAIGQAHSDPELAKGERLEVRYQGTFNLASIVEDSASILERRSAEIGTGRYEQITRDDQLDGQDLVQEKGLSLLRRFASLDDVVGFDTDVSGLSIGQLVSVSVPEQGLNDEFLVTQMETESLGPAARRYHVTATTGELKGHFQEWFAALVGSRGPISIREGEILQEVLAVHDPVAVTDSVVATLINVVTDTFGTGEVGTGEFGV